MKEVTSPGTGGDGQSSPVPAGKGEGVKVSVIQEEKSYFERITREAMPVSMQENKGFHGVLAEDHPYIFVDGCMQIWPDADFSRAHRHGVTAYGVTAWMPHAPVEEALEGIMYWHLVCRRYPQLAIARSVDDIRSAKPEQRATLLLAAQCGNFMGRKLHRIEAFYHLGLRMLIFAYNASNQLAAGCLDVDDSGLTRLGRLAVAECNRVGLLLDGSHLGKRSSLEMVDQSQAPVVFSHSGAKAIVDNPRNIDDEQILACAHRGGVIGVVRWGPLCLKAQGQGWPSVDDFIDHIDHVTQLTGSSQHVGVGTDMSLGTYPDHEHDPWGDPGYPSASARYDQVVTSDIRSPRRALREFHDYAQIGAVIERLSQRGYDEADIGNILGENFLRVCAQVWK